MTYFMSIEDKLDNWAKYSTAGQKQVLLDASSRIRELIAALQEIDRANDHQAMFNPAIDKIIQGTLNQKAEDK